MSPKIQEISRKDLIIKAKRLKIQIAAQLSIKDLEDAVNKAIKKCNSQKIYNKISHKLVLKGKELKRLKRLCDMSDNDLQLIARLQRIANHATMKREDLIYSLLRSEKDAYADNYLK